MGRKPVEHKYGKQGEGALQPKDPTNCDLRSFLDIQKGLKWVIREFKAKKLKAHESKEMRCLLREGIDIQKMRLEFEGKWKQHVEHSGAIQIDLNQGYDFTKLDDSDKSELDRILDKARRE